MATAFEVEKGRLERSAPLLKQSQIEDMQQESKRLHDMLNAPPHIRNVIQDRSQLAKSLREIQKTLDRDSPTPYEGADKDKAVKREKELLEKFTASMPTQAEMRRNPPGALDKHIMWEQKNEADVSEWKNIRRRMLVSGMLPSSMSERSASNIELHRPAGGSGEMSMDGAQIPVARTFYGLGGRSSTFSEEQLAVLKLLAPEIYAKIALLSADERDQVREALDKAAPEAPADPKTVNFDALTFKQAREMCREAGVETSGALADLVGRLKEHYGAA